MAESSDKPFPVREECKQCGTKPSVFLHHVLHKGRFHHICTACVLRLHQGSFCPICFTVYDDQYNLSNDHLKCSSCDATYHLQCIPSVSAFISFLPPTSASSSSSSFSTVSQNYRVLCPHCADPNLPIFNFSRDERTNAVKIDRNSSQQLLAAATIANRSMKKAAKIASVKAQIMCKEAAEARKVAKDALIKVQDLSTVARLLEDSESDRYISCEDDSGYEASIE